MRFHRALARFTRGRDAVVVRLRHRLEVRRIVTARSFGPETVAVMDDCRQWTARNIERGTVVALAPRCAQQLSPACASPTCGRVRLRCHDRRIAVDWLQLSRVLLAPPARPPAMEHDHTVRSARVGRSDLSASSGNGITRRRRPRYSRGRRCRSLCSCDQPTRCAFLMIVPS